MNLLFFATAAPTWNFTYLSWNLQPPVPLQHTQQWRNLPIHWRFMVGQLRESSTSWIYIVKRAVMGPLPGHSRPSTAPWLPLLASSPTQPSPPRIHEEDERLRQVISKQSKDSIFQHVPTLPRSQLPLIKLFAPVLSLFLHCCPFKFLPYFYSLQNVCVFTTLCQAVHCVSDFLIFLFPCPFSILTLPALLCFCFSLLTWI